MRRFLLLVPVAILLVLSAYFSEQQPLCSVKHPPVNAAEEAVTLRLSTASARPGQELTMTFSGVGSERISRGTSSYLDCWNGRKWTTLYVLLGEVHGLAAVKYPLPPDYAIFAVEVMGPGPEPARLPDGLEPGWYRVRREIEWRDEDAHQSKRYEVTAQFKVEE